MKFYFSIENYKRPSEEVDSLLNLARDKFRRLIKEADRFAKEGVRVNVIGNLSLLPSDLQSLIFQAMEVTSKNEKATLNVAFSYTSRDEMTRAVKVLANAVDTGNSILKTACCNFDKKNYSYESFSPTYFKFAFYFQDTLR